MKTPPLTGKDRLQLQGLTGGGWVSVTFGNETWREDEV